MAVKFDAVTKFFYIVGIPISYGYFAKELIAYGIQEGPAWVFLAPFMAMAWPFTVLAKFGFSLS